MGLFGTSRSDIDETIDRLLGGYGSYFSANFDDDIKQIREYDLKKKDAAFNAAAIEKLCGLLPVAANSTEKKSLSPNGNSGAVIERLSPILGLMSDLAGYAPALKTKVIGKACAILPMVANNRLDALPGILETLLTSCKNDEEGKTMVIVSTCDILQSVVSKDPAIAVRLIEKTLAASSDGGSADRAVAYNPYILIKGTDILPALATQNPQLTEQLVKSMLFATRVSGAAQNISPALVGPAVAEDPSYCKTLVVRKGCSVVDIVVNTQPQTAVSLLQNMLVGAGSEKSIKDIVTKKSADILGTLCSKDAAATVGLIKYMLAASFDDQVQSGVIVAKSCALLPVLATNSPAETSGLVQTLLNAGVDEAGREKIIRKACDVLGSLSANNGDAAFSLTQTMLSSVGDAGPLKEAVVVRAADIIPGLVERNPQNAIFLLQNLLSVAGGDDALSRKVVEKVRDILPAVAEKNPNAVTSILDAILSGAGDDEALKKSILDTVFPAIPAMTAAQKGKTNASTEVLDILLKKGATSPELKKTYIQNSCQTLFTVYDKGYGLGLVPRMQAAAAGDPAATQTLIETACGLMPEFVRKDAKGGLDTLKALENSAGSNKALRTTLVNTSATVMAAVLQGTPALGNEYLKQYLSIAQNDADFRKAVLVDSACTLMPEFARKDAKSALETLKTMENSAGGDKALRGAVLNTSEPVMAAVLLAAPELDNGYLRQYLSLTQSDSELKGPVLQQACDALLPLSRKNAEASGNVFQTILQSVGFDGDISYVFADVAVVRSKGRKTMVFNPADVSGQKVVVDNNQSYLQKAFVTAIQGTSGYSSSYSNDHWAIKAHYDSVFDFLSKSDVQMAKAATLKDAVMSRLEGKKTVPPSWPAQG